MIAICCYLEISREPLAICSWCGFFYWYQ